MADNVKTMAYLAGLPTELISLIVEDLERLEDVWPCTLVSRRLHSVSDPILYRRLDQASQPYRECLIFWAISRNQLDLLKRLLRGGANPEALAIRRFCALRRASSGPSNATYAKEVSKFMPGAISRGLGCDHKGNFGRLYQPLHHAVLFENCEMIDALLEAGACIHSRSKEANTTVETIGAVAIHNANILDLALAAPVGLAISLGLKKVIRHLFARGADDKRPMLALPRWSPLTNKGNNAMHMASRHNWQAAEMLWEEGLCTDLSSPNAEGYTPLWEALKIKDWHRVEWLLERGADLNRKNELHRVPVTLLEMACRLNDFDMALRLLVLGADARKSPWALYYCLNRPHHPPSDGRRQDQIRLIRRLITEGVTVKGKLGTTALESAMIRKDKLVVGMLQAARLE